jgi:hypothetical protein
MNDSKIIWERYLKLNESLDIDNQYENYLKNKDFKSLKELIDIKRNEKGYVTGPVYHGTNKQFTVFRPNIAEGLGKGIYFTTDKNITSEYGNTVMSVYIKFENPFEGVFPKDKIIKNTNTYKNAQQEYTNSHFIDEESGELDWYELSLENARFINDLIRELGFDGFLQEIEILAFYPNQVKSSDIITYDDNGNVIPLSKRFDSSKNDIRF